MALCPCCGHKKADDTFRNRRFNGRKYPICTKCFDTWSRVQAQMAFTGLNNQNRSSRHTNDLPVMPWQVVVTDSSVKHNVGHSTQERMYEALKRSRMPVNPQYLPK